MQSHRNHVTAQGLPGQVLEQVLAQVPFRERVRASAVCRAWRQHLSQRGLPLWQAVRIASGVGWDRGKPEYDEYYDDDDVNAQPTSSFQHGENERKLRMFRPLQRWLCRHGGGLRQIQCSTSFNFGAPGDPDVTDTTDDSLLAALLSTLAAAAPSLQALRLDTCAGWTLASGSLMGIAIFGDRLRQLALLGLMRVTDDSLLAALAQLPLLQDLAILFEDERTKGEWAKWDHQRERIKAPDMMRLLQGISMSSPALRMLAIGHLPNTGCYVRRWSPVSLTQKPLPPSMSRLSALSSLTLQHIGWEYAPKGLPCLPQLRRLAVRGDCSEWSKGKGDFKDQLSTLARLEALQVVLPVWPGRLPAGLTQLVLSPLSVRDQGARDHAVHSFAFFRMHLPVLHQLRHLALHGHQRGRCSILEEVCAAAVALPQLVSLHLVNCSLSVMPQEEFKLSRLQLLNLSHNPSTLHADGFKVLAQAPLHQLASCRHLDLRCRPDSYLWPSIYPLQPDTIRVIASMPALEQLALSPADCFGPRFHITETAEMHAVLNSPNGLTSSSPDPAGTEAQLALCRPPGLPPIRVVTEMPDSDRWGALDVELPFGEVNDMLGVQLNCSITRGVPINSLLAQ